MTPPNSCSELFRDFTEPPFLPRRLAEKNLRQLSGGKILEGESVLDPPLETLVGRQEGLHPAQRMEFLWKIHKIARAISGT